MIPLSLHPREQRTRPPPRPHRPDRPEDARHRPPDARQHRPHQSLLDHAGRSASRRSRLDWGCDDLDGTVVWYDITKREGERGTTHQELHVSDIRRLIREAGRVPVERDTLYREVRRGQEVHAR